MSKIAKFLTFISILSIAGLILGIKENNSKDKRIEAMFSAVQSLPEEQRAEAFNKAVEQTAVINASGDIFGKTGK